MRIYEKAFWASAILILYLSFASGQSAAQALPGSVDPGRIQRDQAQPSLKSNAKPIIETSRSIQAQAPEGADNIKFTLRSVTLDGVSVFNPGDLEPLYANKIGKAIPLSFVWDLAATITQYYRDRGYILSAAYVPQQKTNSGDVRIHAIEGRISRVEIESKNKQDRVVRAIINDIIAQNPLRIQDLESNLLRLNDLYNVRFQALLKRDVNGQRGDAILSLTELDAGKSSLSLSSNNYGSQFVGPFRSNITAQHSFADYHQTTFSALASKPGRNELGLISAVHRVQLTPAIKLDGSLSKTKSRPGHSLRTNDIESNSFSWGLGATWTPIRLRNENLNLFGRFEFLNSNTNSFSSALTRDKVRIFRLGANYDFADKFKGLNTFKLTASKGVSWFSGSKEGDTNISRTGASPTFSKIEISYQRRSFAYKGLALSLQANAQIASRSLYSSEEFGYGGINFGRAYDFSEITGDHGLSASAELSYTGINPIKSIQINPFVFYDIGKAWNKGEASIRHISASSAGAGVRVYDLQRDISFNSTIAAPLTKSIDTPLYGNGKNPTVRFEISKEF